MENQDAADGGEQSSRKRKLHDDDDGRFIHRSGGGTVDRAFFRSDHYNLVPGRPTEEDHELGTGSRQLQSSTITGAGDTLLPSYGSVTNGSLSELGRPTEEDRELDTGSRQLQSSTVTGASDTLLPSNGSVTNGSLLEPGRPTEEDRELDTGSRQLQSSTFTGAGDTLLQFNGSVANESLSDPETQSEDPALGAIESGAGVVSAERIAPVLEVPSSNGSCVTSSKGLRVPMKSQSPALEKTRHGKRLPMRRPDDGGTLGCSIAVLVNFFRLEFGGPFRVRKYKIVVKKIDPSICKSSGDWESASSAVDGKVLRSVLARMKEKNLLGIPNYFAYDDGAGNIYCPIETTLMQGTFRVELFGGVPYFISIKSQKELSFSDPRHLTETLQGLGVIMRENMARRRLETDRRFHKLDSCKSHEDSMLKALETFRHSIKPTEDGLVVSVDYCDKLVSGDMHVLKFLETRLGICFNESEPLPPEMKDRAARELENKRVFVTHRKTDQLFRVHGLTDESTDAIMFRDKKSRIRKRLMDYYRGTYQKEIKYKKLPCLNLSKKRPVLVPMEFCQLVEERLFTQDGPLGGNKVLKDPSKRKQKIIAIANLKDGPCRGGDVLDNFHLSVSNEMTEATARVLQPPSLKLRNADDEVQIISFQNEYQWNLNSKKLLGGKEIKHWAVLHFCQAQSSDKQGQLPFDVRQFITDLVDRCHQLGISMPNDPCLIKTEPMTTLSEPYYLSKVLNKCKDKAPGGDLQLLICPMAVVKQDGYNMLKLICETDIGIVTQCCSCDMVGDIKLKGRYLSNLALKINAKLGGSNFELYETLPDAGSSMKLPVMLVGAALNHPSPNSSDKTSPSIAAVVGCMDWPASNNYTSTFQCQARHKGTIQNIGNMCRELIDAHYGPKPMRIIYFRDGVGNSQFDKVLNEELTNIKNAIEEEGYKPKITVVVAQKRHRTRLFLKDQNSGGFSKSSNVPPGTVVDKGITAPLSFDFYLCSHDANQGTSKPTHYHVLWDENGYTSDQLQKLVFDLCFTIARSTKPVSLAPPIYYADLLAYRGRMYWEAMVKRQLLKSPRPPIAGSACCGVPRLPQVHVKGMFFL